MEINCCKIWNIFVKCSSDLNKGKHVEMYGRKAGSLRVNKLLDK